MLISEGYRELNRELHAREPIFGNDNFGWSKYARSLVEGNGYTDVLDYGCGKGRLAVALSDLGIRVQEYDPAIEGKDAMPEPADFVVCTDVLEHIEPVNLNAVLRHLRGLTRRRLFVTIACAPAAKTLADGRNAHLIVKPGPWWRDKMIEHFQILLWEQRGSVVAAELVAKPHTGRIKSAGRRVMAPMMRDYFNNIRKDINDNSDAFSQVKTIRMWEGIDDEPADLQGACDIIEHMDDVDAALEGLAANSLKCTFAAMKISKLHTEHDWRRVIEKRFSIAQWQVEAGHVIIIGAPTIRVQGICAVGAVASDDRWGNVEAAAKRYPGRIEMASAHDRTAIIACYGPSLIDTIETLKADAAKPNVDVISVSGAHDFLLSHGIVPKYHIECDPRPHKALNVDASHPDVTYLIASVCHGDYFDKLGPDANVKLWHVSTTEHVLRLINELGESPRHAISGGGSVGLRSIPLLYAMGYRDMSIHAMDCSFKTDGETTQQWAGKHAGKAQDRCEVLCNGVVFISSPVLLTYATNFFETIQKVTDLNVRLYGRGLLQAMAEYYMSEQASGTPVPFINQIEPVEPAFEELVA